MEKTYIEKATISTVEAISLSLFVLGFSAPLLDKWLYKIVSKATLALIGLLLCTGSIALISLRRGWRRRERRSICVLLMFILLCFAFLYVLFLSKSFPPPDQLNLSRNIINALEEASRVDASWAYLKELFREISRRSSFKRAQVWWLYKVLSRGSKEPEKLLSQIQAALKAGLREEAMTLILQLSRTFESIDTRTLEFSIYYVFLSALTLFFSTIMFLGGREVLMGTPSFRGLTGIFTYSYPLLLSFGLFCSLKTVEPYPALSWLFYTVLMLILFRIKGYERSSFFGFSILVGGLIGAFSPLHPFLFLWYFICFCIFMLLLIPSVLPRLSRDLLLSMSILSGCAGVNSAISMIFIRRSVPASMALISVVYDLLSIMFALSEVSPLPRILSSGIKGVSREGFWPILGFIVSVLLAAFCMLAYFNPIPSLEWILSLSLLCYALIYSMRLYGVKRRRMARFGELSDTRALFIVSIPMLMFMGVFPAFSWAEDPALILLASFSFLISASIFSLWYVRGDRFLGGFLLDRSPFPFIVFSSIVVLSSTIFPLYGERLPFHYLSLIIPTICLSLIFRKGIRKRLV